MAYKPNPKAKAEIDRRIGLLLVGAGIQFQSEMKRALSTSYPPASRPGEFPHGRMWNLREGILYEPTSPAAAAKQGSVRVGYATAAFYGGILELFRGRLGLNEIAKRLRGRLKVWFSEVV